MEVLVMKDLSHKEGFNTVIILVLIAALALLGGVYEYQKKKGSNMATSPLPNAQVTGSVGVASGGASSGSSTSSSLSAGNSDSALDKDAADVSVKLNSLNSDAKNVDTGLNDQQGNLSEQ